MQSAYVIVDNIASVVYISQVAEVADSNNKKDGGLLPNWTQHSHIRI